MVRVPCFLTRLLDFPAASEGDSRLKGFVSGYTMAEEDILRKMRTMERKREGSRKGARFEEVREVPGEEKSTLKC